MKTYVENKIDEVYELALRLGLEDRTTLEKGVFKLQLKQIALSAVDEVSDNLGAFMHEEHMKYC